MLYVYHNQTKMKILEFTSGPMMLQLVLHWLYMQSYELSHVRSEDVVYGRFSTKQMYIANGTSSLYWPCTIHKCNVCMSK